MIWPHVPLPTLFSHCRNPSTTTYTPCISHLYQCSTSSIQIISISSSTSSPSRLFRVPKDFLFDPHIAYGLVLSEIKECFLHSYIYEAVSFHIILLLMKAYWRQNPCLTWLSPWIILSCPKSSFIFHNILQKKIWTNFLVNPELLLTNLEWLNILIWILYTIPKIQTG